MTKPNSGENPPHQPQKREIKPSPAPKRRHRGVKPAKPLPKKGWGRTLYLLWTTPIAKLVVAFLASALAVMGPAVLAGHMPAELIRGLMNWCGTLFGGFWNLISIIIPPHLFTTGATLVVATVAWRALKQKQAADRKAEWWKRTQYALDQLTAKENPKSNLLGADLVDFLSQNHEEHPKLVDKADRKLFKDVVEKLSASVDRIDTMKEPDEGGKP